MHSYPYPYAATACPCCGYQVYPPVPYCPPIPAHTCCPVCHQPAEHCCCKPTTLIKYPREIFADDASGTPTVSTFVGGEAAVKLTLETLSSGDPASHITVVADSVTLLDLAPVPAGFSVKKIPVEVALGSVVELTVTSAQARLRWCEDILC